VELVETAMTPISKTTQPLYLCTLVENVITCLNFVSYSRRRDDEDEERENGERTPLLQVDL